MKPYSRTSVRSHKIHSADLCDICSNGLDSKKTARQKAKQDIKQRLKDQ